MTKTNITMYHNPRCSKSRKALEFIHAKVIDPIVILYLDHQFSFDELKEMLAKLLVEPRDILRVSEPDYKHLDLSHKSLRN